MCHSFVILPTKIINKIVKSSCGTHDFRLLLALLPHCRTIKNLTVNKYTNTKYINIFCIRLAIKKGSPYPVNEDNKRKSGLSELSISELSMQIFLLSITFFL